MKWFAAYSKALMKQDMSYKKHLLKSFNPSKLQNLINNPDLSLPKKIKLAKLILAGGFKPTRGDLFISMKSGEKELVNLILNHHEKIKLNPIQVHYFLNFDFNIKKNIEVAITFINFVFLKMRSQHELSHTLTLASKKISGIINNKKNNITMDEEEAFFSSNCIKKHLIVDLITATEFKNSTNRLIAKYEYIISGYCRENYNNDNNNSLKSIPVSLENIITQYSYGEILNNLSQTINYCEEKIISEISITGEQQENQCCMDDCIIQ